ncbi:hypothetical protein [Deinococcus soli (ex Cha et al. 2016)]|uniref:hypothetical protein n=1 Tax=Deinococcus soli (ex Cha et al. 2016) TaxID=1309411 RepID=UPI00166CA6FF|nr:hypothetical protein [Deinococcus soli (ex Cha et al. 2016)]GGB71599.1 hypothetical protein GCM10008019_29670 [Deinococcus soli (ex Cha et al. 2016)]
MARYADSTPTPDQQRAAQPTTPQPTAAEHDRHAAANAEQVRLLRAHLTGGNPC